MNDAMAKATPTGRDFRTGRGRGPDVLDTKLHKLGGSGAGFQQGLQHQPGSAVLGVCPVKKAQLFLNGQPIDAAPTFRRGPQPGARSGGFKTALLCA